MKNKPKCIVLFNENPARLNVHKTLLVQKLCDRNSISALLRLAQKTTQEFKIHKKHKMKYNTNPKTVGCLCNVAFFL